MRTAALRFGADLSEMLSCGLCCCLCQGWFGRTAPARRTGAPTAVTEPRTRLTPRLLTSSTTRESRIRGLGEDLGLVVGDARLFHATHANTTGDYRTVITIWFHPLFEDLQEPTQSWIHHPFHRQHAEWPPEAIDKIRPVIPDYRGTVEPSDFNRQPDTAKLEQA